jgi:small subunit ribosomal protein S14
MAKKSLINKAEKKQKFKVRQYSRCQYCGRPKGYLRKFGMCRICFRLNANKGLVPGVTKSS